MKNDDPAAFWNARYAEPGLAYGDAANDFLVEVEPRLPRKGRVLCLAEGEGRNAVFLASRGHDVTALDMSAVGLDKTRALAASRGVVVHTVLADLAAYTIAPGAWDAIVAIWMHLPPSLRARVHADAARGLAPGGALVIESYRKEQLALGTGGPRDPAMLVDPETLRADLAGLTLERFEAIERDVHEGRYHGGKSAVVRVLARRT